MTGGIRLKHVARIEVGQSPPSSEVTEYDGEGLPFIQGNAEFGSLSPTPANRCDSAPRVVDVDALLVSVRAPVGAVNIADRRLGIGRGLASVVPLGINSRYAWWLLHASVDELNSVATGSTFTAISGSDLGNLRVPVKGRVAQRAIADYLDRETAQIDAFIAKNEELIALLTERRAAVIADAATGGVRQEARLVDSGVDWIGSIPANWDVRPLRWSARIRTGTTPSGDMVFADEPGEPWIRPDDLDVSGAASVASRWLTPEGATQGRPAVPGATLVCTIGATLGKSGRIERASYFNQQITSVSWALNDEFLYWVFVAAREAVARLSVGNTLPILNNDKLATLRIPVPPVEEQGVIVDYIRAQTTRIDAAIQTAHRGVALARERRAALISAAVTGKIDVGVAV